MAKYVHAPLLTTALTLGVALSAATAAVSSAAAEELQWATQAGGTGGDFGFGIATDGPGNSYVTGAFSSTTTFGAGEDNETELTAAGGSDVFVAKYDRNGQLLWATLAGGTGTDWGNGIAIDGPGNSYVAGIFQGIATFGEGEDNETGLTASGSFDAFVAKYDRSGDLLWAKQASGTSNEIGWGIATDSRGNSYVSGYFSGAATFGDGENNETELSAAGGFDIFVAKYDRNGDLLWATPAGGTSTFDQSFGIATDGPGNSYVTGTFSGTATFGKGEDNETDLNAAGNLDIFVAKYDPNGLLLWATRAGGASNVSGGDQGIGIATDRAGNSHVTGTFSGTATFGEGEDNETELTAAGSPSNFVDIFVAKYDRNGGLAWARRAGGTDSDQGNGIAIDSRGNSHVTGFFVGTATFGEGEDNETELTAAGGSDVFVAKYDRNGQLLWATLAGGTVAENGRGIATDGPGSSYVTGGFMGTPTFGEGEDNETELSASGGDDIFVTKYDR